MKTINGVYQSSIAKFNTRSIALEHSRGRTPQGYHRAMFHGDDGLFWVVSGARDIRRLTEANYERITD